MDSKRSRDDSPEKSHRPQPKAETMSTVPQKGYQRRPDLGLEEALPDDIRREALTFVSTHESSADLHVADLARVVMSLLEAATPDLRLRHTSKLSEATAKISENQKVARDFVKRFAAPILLSPRVRYLHKGTLSILRNRLQDAANDELPVAFREFLANAQRELSAATAEAGAVHTADLNAANTLDTVSVLVAPAFLQGFGACAGAMLPTLRILLDHASHGVGVFDETSGDPVSPTSLDHLRFVLRTVTTALHKFVDNIEATLAEEVRRGSTAAMCEHFSAILDTAVVVLCSTRLPKDLLNASALLIVTGALLGRSLTDDLSRITAALCNEGATCCEPAYVRPPLVTNRSSSIAAWSALLQNAVTAQTVDASTLLQLTQSMSSLTRNGALALFKGLLSHVATARGIADRIDAATIMMCPPQSIIFKTIVPAAATWCERTDHPETRFVAVQTLDAAVRHVVAVLQRVLRCDAANVPTFVSAAEHVRHVEHLCDKATETVVSMWDDPTQKVAGVLTETYEVTLQARDMLLQVTSTGPNASEPIRQEVLGATLTKALQLSDDRRGKFQALSAILPRLGIDEFVARVNQCVEDRAATSDETFGRFSAPLLLRCAVNSKVSNLVGELFCKLAKEVLGDTAAHANAKKENTKADATQAAKWARFEVLCLGPLVNMCVGSLTIAFPPSVAVGGSRGVAADMYDRSAEEQRAIVQGIVTHVVLPLLRFGSNDMLDRMLSRAAQSTCTHAALVSSVTQILFRARGAGLDVSLYTTDAPQHITPTATQTNALLRVAVSAADHDLRLVAFELLCLDSRGASRVSQEQFGIFRDFVLDNVSLGGDSTFRNRLITIVFKWTERLVASVTGARTVAEGQPQYVRKCAEETSTLLAALFEANVCAGVSVDRQFASISMALTILRGVGKIFFGRDASPIAGLLAASQTPSPAWDMMVPAKAFDALVETLEAGWDRLRKAGFDMLVLLSQLSPSMTLRWIEGFTTVADQLESSLFRRAESAVCRLLLASRIAASLTEQSKAFTVLLDSTTSTTVTLTAGAPVCSSLASIAKAASQLLRSRIDALSRVGDDARWIHFSSHPLHGLMALVSGCNEELVKLKHREHFTQETFQFGADVLHCVSTLVNESAPSEGASVDCRGHVFVADQAVRTANTGRMAQGFESSLRMVVNNSWLGARAATSAISSASASVKLPDEHALPPALADKVSQTLIRTLLQSKHNGVISKCRLALKALTATLLRTASARYASIPPAHLSELLFGAEGVQSTELNRMLRRSQGLPHTVLPMLEAEDPSMPAVLVPLAAKHLTEVAAAATSSAGTLSTSLVVGTEDGAEGLGPKAEVTLRGVNALNVLKFVFDDSQLAPRVTPYIEDNLVSAAAGFRHADWFVRNSSLMLFTSVVRRIIGDHPAKGGGGVSSSFSDILKRAPRATEFIVAKLSSSANESIGRPLQPEVYPLLLTVSMLRPDPVHAVGNIVNETATVQQTGQQLRKLLRACLDCLKLSSLMVRVAAAKAIASLVPGELLVGFIGSRSALTSATGDSLHGELLLLHALLRTYAGWERDGGQFARPGEGLRLRESEVLSCRVRDEVALRLCAVGIGSGRLTALSQELYFDVCADVHAAYVRSGTPAPSAFTELTLSSSGTVLQALGTLAPKHAHAACAGTHTLGSAAARCHLGGRVARNHPVEPVDPVTSCSASITVAFAEAVARSALPSETIRQTCGGIGHASAAAIIAEAASERGALSASVGRLEGLEDHLRCVLRLVSQLEVAAAQKLRNAVTSLLGADGSAAVDHTGVCSSAIRLLCRIDSELREQDLQATVALLAEFSTADQPLASRYASAEGLKRLASAYAASRFAEGIIRVAALCGAFAMSFDDDAFVRGAANRCAEYLCGFKEGELSPSGCLRETVAALTHAVCAHGESAKDAVIQMATTLCESEAENVPEDNENEADGALFEAESDNMYVEVAVVRRWLQPILPE